MNHVSRLHLAGSLTAAMALLGGCNAGGDSGGKTTSTAAGGGAGTGSDASGSGGIDLTVGVGGSTSVGVGGSTDCSGGLTVIVRDFTTSNHDFEPGISADDTGIVLPDLGADGKPVYAGNPTTPTTHGKESFDQWYRDVEGVNINIPIKIQLTKGAGDIYTYDNQKFFPIDGLGFGNEGNPNNFHFTDEVHTGSPTRAASRSPSAGTTTSLATSTRSWSSTSAASTPRRSRRSTWTSSPASSG